MIGVMAAAVALAEGAVARPRPAADPVARAIATAGGAAVLARVRSLSWAGTARVIAGETNGPIDLMMETRIEPFVRARSDSWPAAQGRSSGKTLMIEGRTGFMVDNTAQRALTAGMARHEREQFGVYGYLLLAGATVTNAGPRRLTAVREGFPPISLTLGADGRIVGADYLVAAPDAVERPGVDGSARPIREHFVFSGTIADKGVRWPRRIEIFRHGRPFLRLAINDLSVELAPA